jgi:hypothetical protein
MENNIEVWKDITGYEGYYQVSNLGRVKRVQNTTSVYNWQAKKHCDVTIKETVLRQNYNGHYCLVALSLRGKVCKSYVHRLVATAFVPNPLNKREVNHTDFNKLNNKVENLEWCNSKENQTYSADAMKFYAKPVRCLNDGIVHKSLARASRYYGITTAQISKICNKSIDSIKDLRFEFVTKKIALAEGITEPIAKAQTHKPIYEVEPFEQRVKSIVADNSSVVEEWRSVKGYEGSYQVSNLGRIRSVDRVSVNKFGWERRLKGAILKQVVSQSGYYRVSLSCGNRIVNKTVHKLIAEAFIENIDNKSQVNHIDSNKLNNQINNLEWCTQSENTQHSVMSMTFSNSKPVKCTTDGKVFKTIQSAANFYNTHSRSISEVLKGRWKQLNGRNFVYATKEDGI